MLKTTVREWDAQRREVEKERRELVHRLALLNSEIVVHRWLVSGTMLLLVRLAFLLRPPNRAELCG